MVQSAHTGFDGCREFSENGLKRGEHKGSRSDPKTKPRKGLRRKHGEEGIERRSEAGQGLCRQRSNVIRPCKKIMSRRRVGCSNAQRKNRPLGTA